MMGYPDGWSYNSSVWSQRLPIVVLAIIGFIIATYLALFQIGLVTSVFEPFFGSGSQVILTSKISRVLPVPDAALSDICSMLLLELLVVLGVGEQCHGS